MLGEDPKSQTIAGSQPKEVDKEPDDSSSQVISERAAVKQWQDKIGKAKSKYTKAFERMRNNMDFVTGIQHAGQNDIRDADGRYVVNMTLRAVNQGTAMLYAKDPKISAKRRQRLNYQMWDGKLETILQASQLMQMAQQYGLPLPPDIPAVLQDFQQGRMREALIDRIGKTMEVVMQYQFDTQQPSFKTQMKQLVRRVRTCGVGYIKVIFCRDYERELTQSETSSSSLERAKQAKLILEKLEKDKIEADSAEVERLRELVNSLGNTPLDYETVSVKEKLIFDFPQATSIIPDPAIRTLKGFVGAKWIVEEYFLPLDYVNAMFETKIEPGGSLKLYDSARKVDEGTPTGPSTEQKKMKVCLWEVQDLTTKSTFVICEGWKDYVDKPKSMAPATKGFWNIVPVTFNDIEVEDGCKATIFPPSDVDLMWSAQTQWNARRQALAKHRDANAPRYLYPDGMMSEEDLDRLVDSDGQEFIKLKGVNPGTDLSKVVIPLGVTPIEGALYDTEPLREDTLLATGQQEANIGPAQPNVTATVGTIAEQSRMSVAASDVDGLDDALTCAVQCGGEMLFREMSQETVTRIAGIGAVWPNQNPEEFIDEIEMEIVAASSGRPNKAIEVANWERIAPLLMQSGANPQAIIRESVKRLDDNLQPADFYPVPIPQMPQQGQAQEGQEPPASGAKAQGDNAKRSAQQKPKGGQRQPLQPSQSGVAVPLAGT